MYFSRVAKIIQDAEVSQPDIRRTMNTSGGHNAFMAQPTSEPHSFSTPDSNGIAMYPPGSGRADEIGLAGNATSAESSTWADFIDSLLGEWKTLNVVSALLISAILTMFQIPSVDEDLVTKTPASLSLVCAMMSLIYGCIYRVKFGAMRSIYWASKWAEEVHKTDTLIWWNVWVLLAMPSVWMSWSMIFFITSILSFLWRTGPGLDPDDHPPPSAHAALGSRIAITVVFSVGIVYFVMIVRTLRSYGTHAGGATHEQRAANVEIAVDRWGSERERSAAEDP